MNVALNAKGALKIGIIGGASAFQKFHIGFSGYLNGAIESCNAAVGTAIGSSWGHLASEGVIYSTDKRQWAVFVPAGTVGINEAHSKVPFNVFPNPAENYINIETTADVKSIELFDHTGKVVMYNKAYQSRLDVSTMDTGMYFLRIEDEKGNTNVQKVLIK